MAVLIINLHSLIILVTCYHLITIGTSVTDSRMIVAATPEDDVHICGADANLTLAYWPSMDDVWGKESDPAQKLSDLKGFSVYVFTLFFKECTFNHTFVRVEDKNLTRLFGDDSSINVFINVVGMEVASLKASLLSHSVATFPIAMVWKNDPEVVSSSMLSMFTSFLQPKDWLLLITVAAPGAAASALVFHLEDCVNVGGGTTGEADIVDGIWNYCFIFLGVGDLNERQGLASRIMMMTWAATVTVVIAILYGHFASDMTVSRLQHPLRSIQDLIDQKFFWAGYLMRKTHATISALRSKYDEIKTTEMMEYEWARESWQNRTEVLLDDDHVLVTWPVMLKAQVPPKMWMKDSCEVTMVTDCKVQVSYHHAFSQRHHKLLRFYNEHTQRLHEKGELQKIVRRWSVGSLCEAKPSTKVAMKNKLWFMEALAGIGTTVAFITAVGKYAKANHQRSRVFH